MPGKPLACLLLLCLVMVEAWATEPNEKTGAIAGDYVGSVVCAGCHRQAYDKWRGSHHDLAMQPATPATVLGDFNDVTYNHFGVESRFYRRGDSFYVQTDNARGELEAFEIQYTFGVYPLQQYLIGFPDGRYQALSIAWDARPKDEGGQRWFHLYPDEAMSHDDPLHWTGPYQNWNSRCSHCHSTELQKNYDPVRDRYDTRWAEINVACEACHGPGSTHLAWAKSTESERRDQPDKGLARDLRTLGQWQRSEGQSTAQHVGGRSEQLEVCASCHSRRTLIDDPNRVYGFDNAHRLRLLVDPLYYSDGQIRDEVYVFGSFLQSKMYRRGVVCSNCHDPHTLQLKADGNGVCSQCHAPATFDTSRHHHHPKDSTGAQCTNCHMPETTYMVVDPRRDHSLRIPRPDLSDALGTPNACTQCHTDRSNRWAAQALADWLRETGKTLPTHYGEALHAGQAGHANALPQLLRLAQAGDQPAIARGTALALLQQYPSREAWRAAQASLRDPDPLLRRGAIQAVEMLPPLQRVADLWPLLRDPVKAVRLEAARLLASVPDKALTSAQQGELHQALREYEAVLRLETDTPGGQLDLGLFYAARRDYERAEAAYRRALAFDPAHVPARLNLADLYREQGRDGEGETVLREALDRMPEVAAVHHALGLLLVRQRRYAAAEPALQRAATLAPDNPRYGYVYAAILDHRGKTQQAVQVLETLHTRHPNNREVLAALVDHAQRLGRWEVALHYAQRLQQLLPDDPSVAQLIRHLQRRAGRTNSQ